MIGADGEALTAIAPDTAGQVRVRGEIWRAISQVTIAAGSRVRVTRLSGLTVIVEPASSSQADGDSR
jgi:membrane-bound ClpP family serine protease